MDGILERAHDAHFIEALIAAPPPAWDSEVDDTLVCRAVRRETHDVMTFVFEAPEPRVFAYRPGQFMTFAFEIGGETVNRCYTIASSPTRPHRLEITVKKIPGGPVSTWLHENLKPGMRVTALGPMGDFTCAAHPARKYLFLSAGSGITPLMSMTRAHHDLASDADIAFVHSARSPVDLIFRDELALMAREQPRLRVTTIIENDAPLSTWTGYRGRIDLARLELIVPDFREREVFVCGPAPYMEGVRQVLAEAGFDMAHYHNESFDFSDLADDADAPAEPAKVAVQSFKVEFTTSRRSLEVPSDQFVLGAAKTAGMRLPSSCAKGMCGTCKCKLVSGTVEMTHAGGIRQREIDQGMILTCCSRPTSDLVMDR